MAELEAAAAELNQDSSKARGRLEFFCLFVGFIQ